MAFRSFHQSPFLALALGAVVLLSACSDDDGGGASASSGGTGGSSASSGGSGSTTAQGTGGAGGGTGGAGDTGGGGTGGGTGGGGGGGTGGTGGGADAQGIVPNPIISRGKPAFASAGTASVINDGKYRSAGTWIAGKPTSAAPAWVAIQVGTGYERLLLSWTASYNYNYTDVQYGAPGAYRVETSSDSTNGSDGTWTKVAEVTNNPVRTRAHSFDFGGKSWVRLVVTAAPATTDDTGVQLDEIDVHDISKGAEDTWFFLGDSITAFAYDRDTPATQPSFAENVHAAHPAHYPAMINGGIGGELTKSSDKPSALDRIDDVLEMNPDFHYFAIGYGTNDSWDQTDPSTFKANLQQLIDKIEAAGRVPVLAHIPFSPDGHHNAVPAFNQAIDALTEENGLPPGPDLYAWFEDHPTQFTDKVHPDPAGRVAMNKLWADAVDGLYPAQR
ncbi:GDSL-type esterase/lipase family protein [Sorangium sp. So ce128]|uniref:GDSL-type esterase/lipase family protein n=1 Tax=Sorangium sp. So ce128 TaxID=3133281 RepID=UPI003F5E9070